MHAEVQRQGQVLKAALSRLGNLGLSVAFHHWEGVVRTRKFRQARAVHLLLVAETRLKQRRWGVAMRHWSGWAASKRAERAQVRRGRRACARLLLAHNFELWCAALRAKWQAKRVVKQMLHRHLASAFSGWVRVLEERAARLSAALNCFAAWGDGFVERKLFARWVGYVQAVQEERSLRPALAGLSPNLVARYKSILGSVRLDFDAGPAAGGARVYPPSPGGVDVSAFVSSPRPLSTTLPLSSSLSPNFRLSPSLTRA